jgi:7tm Chemosensory receptor
MLRLFPNIGQHFGLLIPKLRFQRIDWFRWIACFAIIHLMISLYISVPENFLYIAVHKFKFFYCCDLIVHFMLVTSSYTIALDTWLKRRYLVKFHQILTNIDDIIKICGLPVHNYLKLERREFLQNVVVTLGVCTTLNVVHLTKIYNFDSIWFYGDSFCSISNTIIIMYACTFINYLTVLKTRKKMFEELLQTFCAQTQWRHNENRSPLRRQLKVLQKLYVCLWQCTDQLNAYFGRMHVITMATLWWYTTLSRPYSS